MAYQTLRWPTKLSDGHLQSGILGQRGSLISNQAITVDAEGALKMPTLRYAPDNREHGLTRDLLLALLPRPSWTKERYSLA